MCRDRRDGSRHTRRQDLGFEDRRDQRRSFETLHRIEQGIETGPRSHHALPVGEQSPEDIGLNRFNPAAQDGKRPTTDASQDFRVTPLARLTRRASGPKGSFKQLATTRQPLQRGLHRFRLDTKAPHGLARGEGTMSASIAAREIVQHVESCRTRLKKNLGEAWRNCCSDGVAIARGIFGGDVPGFASDRDSRSAARLHQRRDRLCHLRACGPCLDFGSRKIAEAKHKSCNPSAERARRRSSRHCSSRSTSATASGSRISRRSRSPSSSRKRA